MAMNVAGYRLNGISKQRIFMNFLMISLLICLFFWRCRLPLQRTHAANLLIYSFFSLDSPSIDKCITFILPSKSYFHWKNRRFWKEFVACTFLLDRCFYVANIILSPTRKVETKYNTKEIQASNKKTKYCTILAYYSCCSCLLWIMFCLIPYPFNNEQKCIIHVKSDIVVIFRDITCYMLPYILIRQTYIVAFIMFC